MRSQRTLQLKESNTLESSNTKKSTRMPAFDLHIHISWVSRVWEAASVTMFVFKERMRFIFLRLVGKHPEGNGAARALPWILNVYAHISSLDGSSIFTRCESYMKGSISLVGIYKKRWKQEEVAHYRQSAGLCVVGKCDSIIHWSDAAA